MISRFKKRSRLFWAITGFTLIAGVGSVDFLTGYEFSFSLFYLLPISLTTWYVGIRLGFATSVVSAFVWLTADVYSGHLYSNILIPYWNTAIRFGFFLITTLLISALSKALEQEKELARIDNLTGAVNKRFFSELVQMEVDRSQRFKHTFTIAYVDLDNFKKVNDRFGHSEGDKVLVATVKQAKKQLRKTDVLARLGGDEFAFLLPETDEAESRIIIPRIQLSLLEEMSRNHWPVTFSIGVLTCINIQISTDELIKQADDLMYSVKNNGKNSISYSVSAD